MPSDDAENLTDREDGAESFREEGRTISVPSRLRATWALLVVALVACLAVAYVSFRGVADEVAPVCPSVIESAERPPNDALLRVPGGLGPQEDAVKPVDRLESGRIVRVAPTKDHRLLECGSVALDPKVDAALRRREQLELFRSPDDVYVLVDGNHPFGDRDGLAVFRHARAQRVYQRGRLGSPSQLPAVVSLLAIAALAFAFVRSRRGIVYATKLHAWTEGELGEGGRVLSPEGEPLGVVATTSRRLVPGPVLVAPQTSGDAGYREMRMLDRKDLALGSHARWAQTTMRGLRDARALAIVSTVASTLGLAGHFLGA